MTHVSLGRTISVKISSAIGVFEYLHQSESFWAKTADRYYTDATNFPLRIDVKLMYQYSSYIYVYSVYIDCINCTEYTLQTQTNLFRRMRFLGIIYNI